MKKITPQIRLFINAILKGENQAKAAISAGYPKGRAKVTGCELAKIPEVKAEIERRLAEIDKKVTIDAAAILSGLDEVTQRCMKELKKGKFNSSAAHAALKGLELQGKLKAVQAFGEEKKEGEVNPATNNTINAFIFNTIRAHAPNATDLKPASLPGADHSA